MTRRLILMRHGKSDWATGAASDFDRPLNRRGEKDVPRMGAWLRKQGLVPDRIVSSPALRARQTALLAAVSLGYPEDRIEWRREIYEAGCERLLDLLGRLQPPVPLTLMVGHNPGFEDLIEHLAAANPLAGEDKALPTAAMVGLELPDDWTRLQSESGRVIGHMRPRWL
jgi:phosphohistidine phosphatase